MKFVCDRCKTRYSIGDDRVRGKILKIRCKNCANVITVREGMMGDPEAVAAAAPAGRHKKSTTAAPEAMLEERREAAAAALARDADPSRRRAEAPASASPRTTGAVSAKDVKLPVGPQTPKVPAGYVAPDFGAPPGKRGLRTEDAARPLGKRSSGLEAQREEPTALGAAFASAMAKPPPALEEEWYVSIDGDQAGPFGLAEAQSWVAQRPFDAELHCWSEGFDDWLPVDKVSHFRGLRKRPAPPPVPRISGGTPRAQPTAPTPPPAPPVDGDPKPLFAATMAAIERAASPSPGLPAPASARATPQLGTPTVPRANGTQSGALAAQTARAGRVSAAPLGAARANPLAVPFDTSDDGDPDSELEATKFRDAIVVPSAPSSLAGPPPGNAADAIVTAAASDFESDAHGGDDLNIGEVSRVVNLADIARPSRSAFERPSSVSRGATGPIGRVTGPIGRLSGQIGTFRAATPNFNALADAPPGPAAPADATPSQIAPAAKAHRRGLIVLLSVAGVMVLGVIGAVVLLVTTSDDSTGQELGQVRDIDTSRPEDPITHRPIDPGPSAVPNPLRPAPRTTTTRPSPTGSGTLVAPKDPDPAPAGNSLRGDEIEEMARKHQDMTQRCYLRSQRGADSIIVGDVRKIAVTLIVDKDGNVTDLQLSEHAGDNLGKCLISSIKGWKFRQSSGGTFRISLAFVSG